MPSPPPVGAPLAVGTRRQQLTDGESDHLFVRVRVQFDRVDDSPDRVDRIVRRLRHRDVPVCPVSHGDVCMSRRTGTESAQQGQRSREDRSGLSGKVREDRSAKVLSSPASYFKAVSQDH